MIMKIKASSERTALEKKMQIDRTEDRIQNTYIEVLSLTNFMFNICL